MTTIEYLMSPESEQDAAAVFDFIFGSHPGCEPHTRLGGCQTEGYWTFTPSDFKAKQGTLVLEVTKGLPLTLQVTREEITCALPAEVLAIDQTEVLKPSEYVYLSPDGIRVAHASLGRAAAARKLAMAAAKLNDAATERAHAEGSN